MPKPIAHRPGPGRSTQEDAFAASVQRVAERNEKLQLAARKLRTVREQDEVARKRRHETR